MSTDRPPIAEKLGVRRNKVAVPEGVAGLESGLNTLIWTQCLSVYYLLLYLELLLVSAVLFFFIGLIISFSFPYALAIFLIILSLSICFLVRWFYRRLIGLLIFIIYVGGVLIIFLYSLRVLPNEKNIRFYSDYRRGFFYFLCLWVLFVSQGYHFEKMSIFNYEMSFHYIRLVSFGGIFVFMALVLFFLILVVCNLCDKKRIPLRKLG